jgi:pimeloyl-ACP methyl ester carboxylesterase
LANRNRILSSASKIFKQFRQSPWTNFGCLSKSFKTLKPLLWQMLLFGYQFAFHLPPYFAILLGMGGNQAFLRGANQAAYGAHKSDYKIMESLAVSMGPSEAECNSGSQSGMNGAPPKSYGASVLDRAKSPKLAWFQMTRYYTDGAGSKPWCKSLETIADLYALESEASASPSPARRRSSTSTSSSIFPDVYKGALRAPTTILWGEKDQACTKRVCLEGIGDYLAKDSEVILLPRSGHWTPVEPESRAALARIIGFYASGKGEKEGSVVKYANEVYEGATLMVKK